MTKQPNLTFTTFSPLAAEQLANELAKLLPDGPAGWRTSVTVLSARSAVLTVERPPHGFVVAPNENGAHVRGLYTAYLQNFPPDIKRTPETYVDLNDLHGTAQRIANRFLRDYFKLCDRMDIDMKTYSPQQLASQGEHIAAHAQGTLRSDTHGRFYGNQPSWGLAGEVQPHNMVRMSITTNVTIAEKIAELLAKEGNSNG